MTYKTTKQQDSKRILAMIRKMVAQHKAEIADKLNVDSPAIARNDHHGKPVGGARLRHTAKRQQFQKLHNEAAEDDKMEPGNADDAKVGRGRDKMDGKEKENDPVVGKVKTGKTGDIVMYPDEKEYGNAEGAQKVMDTRSEQTITQMYEAYLNKHSQKAKFMAAAPLANDNPKSKSIADGKHHHVNHWKNDHVRTSSGGTFTPQEAYHSYCLHCEKHKREPLPRLEFDRHLEKTGIPKANISGRERYFGAELEPHAEE